MLRVNKHAKMLRVLCVWAFFSLSVQFLSCSRQKTIDVIGEWHAEISYEQELAKSDDEDTIIATAQFVQENTFVFGADGNYTRTIATRFLKARSFIPDVSETDIASLFADYETTYILSGTYKIQSNKLTLYTKTATDTEGQNIEYQAFFEQTKAYGAPTLTFAVEKPNDNTIIFQGVTFFRTSYASE